LARFVVQHGKGADEEFLPFVGEEDANAAEQDFFVGDIPAAAAVTFLLRRKWGGDFGAFVHDGDFLARRSGIGGLTGHPFGVGDDSTSCDVAGASDAALADGVSDPAGNDDGNMFMGAREPCGGNCVRFVGVQKIVLAGMEQGTYLARGRQTEAAARNEVNGDSDRLGAFTERRAVRGKQLGRVAAAAETLEQEKRLVLATAPRQFEVHKERFHARDRLRPRVAETSLPSLAYLMRTERAAMRAIRAPR
jgi:hypothetical protein